MLDGNPTDEERAEYEAECEMIAKAKERAKTTAHEVVKTWLEIRELNTRYNQLVSQLVVSIRDSEDFHRVGNPCPPYVVTVGDVPYVVSHNFGAPPSERVTITPCRIV